YFVPVPYKVNTEGTDNFLQRLRRRLRWPATVRRHTWAASSRPTPTAPDGDRSGSSRRRRARAVKVTPAEVGFGEPVDGRVRAADIDPALAGTCTAYGQARSAGDRRRRRGQAGGALTVPVTTQIDKHLARLLPAFKDSDLIVVWARQQRRVRAAERILGRRARRSRQRVSAGEITRRARRQAAVRRPEHRAAGDEGRRAGARRLRRGRRSSPTAGSTSRSATCPTRR
ncbi:MAG: hypothetical protein MZW92_34705, partial [Comamonadaceae bacterium]|nr:hypothetical protein [Comamonadaceae bacterium]